VTGATSIVVLTNRLRNLRLASAEVHRVAGAMLAEAGLEAEVAIHFISARRSAVMNRQFLQHEGPTDILTFDQGSTRQRLRGELFVCVAEAIRQSREFGTAAEEELLRYVIHGLLHLRGYDDLEAAHRRIMKREENRLVRKLVRSEKGTKGRKLETTDKAR
jgi:probable rRNA maturation factor